MSDVQKSWVYYDSDAGCYVYRAYIIGACTRSLVAARLGETPMANHFLRPYLDASAGLEDAILNRVQEDTGDQVIWQQKTVELPIEVVCEGPDDKFVAKVIIRGHVDGMRREEDCIVDAKAMGPTNFAVFEENDGNTLGALDDLKQIGRQYRWQGAVYGHATDRKMQFAVGEKLKREDETFYIRRVILESPVSPSLLVPLEDIEKKIRTIEEYAAMDELPPCDAGCREGDPFSEVHEFASKNYTRHDSGGELESLLHEYRYLSAQIDELSNRKTDIGDRIKLEYGVGEHMAGGFKASVVHVNGSRFDTKSFKKRHRELYEEFVIPNPSVRLTVKEIGGAGDETDVPQRDGRGSPS